MAAQRHPLPGARWHFQHGPMDIVIGASGQPDAVAQAHEAAWQRFLPLLDELVAELPLLRQPVAGACALRGNTARCMWQACAPLRAAADGFITPMAAVAGAVAQTLIAAYQRPGIARAWVNNGGDIALHLAAGERLRVGLFADLAGFDAAMAQRGAEGRLALDGGFAVHAEDAVRGIATSGWRGRSFSLGIADSVTVLAADAAMADAAATVLANAVDLDDARIARRPAHSLRDDSDLGERLVTVGVPPLPPPLIRRALQRGLDRATELQRRGLIDAAVLVCQGQRALLPRAHACQAVMPLESVSDADRMAA